MTCCNNPIDLGCKSACAPITTTIPTAQTGFSVVYNFNGTWVSTPAEVVDGYVTVPAGTFNESSNVTFQIFNNVNAFVACFKASIHPGDVDFEINKPVLIPIDTVVEFTSYGCTADLFRGRLRVTISNTNGLKVGTQISLDIAVLHAGNTIPYALSSPDPYQYSVNYNIIEINVLGLQVIEVDIEIANPGCGVDFSLDCAVSNIDNQTPGYFNQTNTPMPQFIYP